MGAGRVAGLSDIEKTPFGLVFDPGDCREDVVERGARTDPLLQSLRCADLHETAGIWHTDAVAQLCDLVHQMGGEEDRRAEPIAQSAHVSPDRPSRHRIETDGRLAMTNKPPRFVG